MADHAVIRIASVDDAAAIEATERLADVVLFTALGADEPLEAEEGTVRLAMSGFVLVAEVDGRVVGFAHVLEFDDECHLEQLSVQPEHARHGVGRALVRAAKDQAAGHGFSEMTLRTYADIAWNAPFYATCGFRVTDPDTAFRRELVDVEAELGLADLGARVQMTAPL